MAKTYDQDVSSLEAECERYIEAARSLRAHVEDTELLVWQALRREASVLLEGAQGTMLDLDHGTYPFVTSSNPVAGYACVGAGIGPIELSEIWGVAKAYTTRVGAGPFPTELTDETGETLREAGLRVRHHHRPSAPLRLARPGCPPLCRPRQRTDGALHHQARRSQRLRHHQGLHGAIATRTRCCRNCRSAQTAFAEVEPVYEELPGWKSDISGATSVQDLPQETIDYLNFIINAVRVPISLISVGSRREQHIKVPYPNIARRPLPGEEREEGHSHMHDQGQ